LSRIGTFDEIMLCDRRLDAAPNDDTMTGGWRPQLRIGTNFTPATEGNYG